MEVQDLTKYKKEEHLRRRVFLFNVEVNNIKKCTMKKKKVPHEVNDIVLAFSPKMDAYQCFRFYRRLEIAYKTVREVLGLSVRGVAEKGSTKKRVTARRFICRVLSRMHPEANLKLLASAILRDHATVIHYRKYDIGEKYNYYYSKKIPSLETRFKELLDSEDFDLVDDGKLYSVEDIRRLMSRMFAVQITVKTTRASRRHSVDVSKRRKLPIHPVQSTQKRKRTPVFIPKRSH